jgi:tetratricopeptide (TPR) repeat protein
MDSDDQPKQSEEERKRMLEEIRRRSEAAEMKRIEDDETVSPEPVAPAPPPAPAEEPGLPSPPPAASPPDQSPFEPPPPDDFSPFPVPEPNPSALSSEEQQRALILKEKFLIAVDRGKAEKASEILSELNLILPHEEVMELREKLHQLEEDAPRGRGKKRQEEPPPASAKAPSVERPRGGEQRKKISELLENVNSSYQQEKYTAALQGIAEILRLDGENEEALRLKEEILRAQQLAEQIAMEDEKRRKEEAAARSALRKSEHRSGKIQSERRSGVAVPDGDFWGSSVSSAPDSLGIDIAPEEKGPAAPPKPPIFDRMAEHIVKIKIPVKPLLIGLAVIVAGAAVYLVVDNIRNAVAPPLYSVLVLPPTVSPGDSALQGLAEGLAVDLTKDLSAVSDLRVIGMSTAFALDASTMANLQRSRAVLANFYLHWSITQQGESIALQAELYDTASSKPLWTSRKFLTLRDLARVKTEMAQALVTAMDIKVSDEELQMLKEIPTSDQYAYTAYLRARFMMRHPNLYPINSVIRALGDAVAADSSFGGAQSALGWAHVLAYEGGDRAPAHLAEARARVQRAVASVLRNPEAYRVWGVADFAQGQFDEAVERFEQAVAIAPSDVESQCRLAGAYIAKNQPDAALKAANRAVMNDPWVVTPYTTLAQVQHFVAIVRNDNLGDYRTALQTYEQGMRLAPDRSEYGSAHVVDLLVMVQQTERAMSIMADRLARARQSSQDLYILGRVEQSAGKPKAEWQDAFRRALEILKAAIASHPDDALAFSQAALVHTRLGEFREAIAADQLALRLAPTDPAILYNTARMYAMQNEKEQAKNFLTKALDRYYSLADILDRDFSALHTEPDFVKIVTR